MKRFIAIFVTLVAFCSVANAQRAKVISGNIENISDIDRLKLVMDWSDVRIRGFFEADFLSVLLADKTEEDRQKWIEYWNSQAKSAFEATFRMAFMERQVATKRIYLAGSEDDSVSAVMKVRIIAIDDNNNVTAEITVTDALGNNRLIIEDKGRASAFGTMQYCIRMAFKSLGGRFAAIVAKRSVK